MNFISRIIKSINAMRERLKIERHEAMYGPHFNEECALKAVSKMENEDGSRGEHWSLEETTSIANQYGINLKGEKYNKYDWYVALNMIRSDYYRAVVTMTSSDHIKYFVELAKAWLNDKDIEEGKMWYYYCYIMCDKLRKEAKTMLMLEDDEDEEHEYRYARGGRGRGRGRGGRMTRYGYDYDEDDEYLDREREEERMHRYEPNRVRRIDQGGIPTLDTIFSNVDTTNNTVTYGICPFQWRQLPCRGLMLLNINHTATGATEGSLVSVATSVSSSQVSSNPTSVNTNSGKALLNGSGDQMPTEEISTGNKYLIYYDKRTGVFQTINHIVAPAA